VTKKDKILMLIRITLLWFRVTAALA